MDESLRSNEQRASSRDVWSFLETKRFWQGATLVLAALFFFTTFVDVRLVPRAQTTAAAPEEPAAQGNAAPASATASAGAVDEEALRAQVLPAAGVELPIAWGDLGQQLVANGVIDRAAFLALYDERGGLGADDLALLDGNGNGTVRMTAENAPYLLNLLWAFGLANENSILTQGPMEDPRYGGAGNFASTGGWTLAVGAPMDHYSAHALVVLTEAQQALVERVAQNIYRPCCGNSTYFPDCNHGMAMLGLLELMAAASADEQTMYDVALEVNAYWFPQTYLTLAKYEAGQGTAWADVDARKLLSAAYSSAAGYRNIAAQVSPVSSQGGGGCGV